MKKLSILGLLSASIGMGSMPSVREIPMERRPAPNPKGYTYKPARRKSRRQKYRAPAFVGERDPRHIHPRHLRNQAQ